MGDLKKKNQKTRGVGSEICVTVNYYYGTVLLCIYCARKKNYYYITLYSTVFSLWGNLEVGFRVGYP